MRLFIANKNYSSWSLRPWLALRVKDIPFEEVLVPFEMEAGNPKFAGFSPTRKVPVLEDDGVAVWESLAILEYLVDRYPSAGLWPDDVSDRARARSISCEMLSGFPALRAECPMNIRRKPAPITVSDGVQKDVGRITAIWRECLQRSGGPFLFGNFTNADAMYAPVVNRLAIYCLDSDADVRKYSDSMTALDAWKEWEQASRAEPWTVAEDER